MTNLNQIIEGNCLCILKSIESESIDLIYLDPPFFTQKEHSLSNRDNTVKYSFEDKFSSITEYLDLIAKTLSQCKRILKSTGSIFLHCDKNASHLLRVALDNVFGKNNFQSEIVWSYKRWSNSKKGLLSSHQIIFFYSKTNNFKFNTIYTNYSATTNIDQILQERKRDGNGKSSYKKDETGNVILGQEKKGVPLSDVWEIPYLNPKAKERCGYPTQKPVLLLNQIIKIATNVGDVILDPFCGSGTSCVSAKALGRNYIGIDIKSDAVILAKSRLEKMIITNSRLLNIGIDKYSEKTEREIALLESLNAVPVQRNSGIDGFLKEHFNGLPIPVKIQKINETVESAIEKLERASRCNGFLLKILIQTNESHEKSLFQGQSDVKIIKMLDLQLQELLKNSSNTEFKLMPF